MTKQYKKQSGFTLMEVLAVTAISGTLAAVSVPMIEGYQADKSKNAAQNAFKESVQVARETAVSQGHSVSICPSIDGKSCSGDWSDGWIVYVGEQGQVFSAANVLHTAHLDGDLELELISETPQLVKSLTFDESGFSQESSRVTASFCNSSNELMTLTVERSGRVVDSSDNVAFQEAFLKSVQSASISTNTRCTRA